MKNLLRLLTANIVMLCFTLGATAAPTTFTGKSDPFTFNTLSAPVPLSWPSLGIAVLLILGFLIGHHILSVKKYGIVKRIVPFFLLVFLAGSFFAFARPPIDVEIVESETGSGRTEIEIDVPERRGPLSYNISAEVSFDDGDNWEDISIEHLELVNGGDDGPITVSPGESTLIWDGGASHPGINSDNAVIKITATKE